MENLINSSYIWFAIGIFFIIVEFAFLPVGGALFSGLGAITTAVFIQLGLADTLLYQLSVFFISTVLWGIILWKPMKRFSKNKKGYVDMIGDKIVVIEGLTKDSKGLVKWSGTEMYAILHKDASRLNAKKGDSLEIVQVDGNILIVK